MMVLTLKTEATTDGWRDELSKLVTHLWEELQVCGRAKERSHSNTNTVCMMSEETKQPQVLLYKAGRVSECFDPFTCFPTLVRVSTPRTSPVVSHRTLRHSQYRWDLFFLQHVPGQPFLPVDVSRVPLQQGVRRHQNVTTKCSQQTPFNTKQQLFSSQLPLNVCSLFHFSYFKQKRKPFPKFRPWNRTIWCFPLLNETLNWTLLKFGLFFGQN